MDFLGKDLTLKQLISVVLSSAIVLGSVVLKLPQIVKIVRAKSVAGLSPMMFLLETFAFSITALYGVRAGFPFRAYGENVIILVQNVTIDVLMLVYGGASLAAVGACFAATGAFAYGALGGALSDATMASAQAATILLFISSKLPQIWSAYKLKSTGELDLFMVLMQFSGTAARVFTSLQDVPDPVYVGGFVIATTLNLTMLLQILFYGGGEGKAAKKKKTQ